MELMRTAVWSATKIRIYWRNKTDTAE